MAQILIANKQDGAYIRNSINTMFAELYSGITTGKIPITENEDRTITSADFGKSIRVDSADLKTMQFPSVGSADDGMTLRFIQIGVGNIRYIAADLDTLGDGSDTDITSTSRYFVYDFEYIHAETKWVLNTVGDWETT